MLGFSAGPSLQSAPLYPGQHLHSSSVTVLYATVYRGLKLVWYLPTQKVFSMTHSSTRHGHRRKNQARGFKTTINYSYLGFIFSF